MNKLSLVAVLVSSFLIAVIVLMTSLAANWIWGMSNLWMVKACAAVIWLTGTLAAVWCLLPVPPKVKKPVE